MLQYNFIIYHTVRRYYTTLDATLTMQFLHDDITFESACGGESARNYPT